MPTGRLFTLEEALALLPTVRQLIHEIQQGRGDLDARSRELDRLMALTSGNGHLAADIASTRAAVQEAGEKLQDLLDELDGLGVELKGLEDGLVDFPSERERRTVYLCWRLGEDTIRFWHELDGGFAGRQPL